MANETSNKEDNELEDFERSINNFLDSDSEVDQLEDTLEEIYDFGGLEVVSHLYGLNKRENQFEDLYQAYIEFYRVKDFRDGSRKKQKKLNNLMESYREYFGPGSNEEWNKGVELATGPLSILSPGKTGALSKDELRKVLKEF